RGLRRSRTKPFPNPSQREGNETLSDLFRRAFDGLANAHVGGAATKISAHRFFNVCVRRFRRSFEQRHRAHDLSALAVTALDHVFGDPRLLDRTAHRVLPHAFNRSYLPIANEGNRDYT